MQSREDRKTKAVRQLAAGRALGITLLVISLAVGVSPGAASVAPVGAACPAPAAIGRPVAAWADEPIVATFSIAACDTAAGTWGVAVASRFLAVGSVVPWARGGTGAVATQAACNTTFGPRGLELMEKGLLPEEALLVLLREDSGREKRQVGLVDAHGRSATYTGKECMNWAGGLNGPGYAVQGNILTGPEVVAAMAQAFESSTGFLGDRMLAALEAGDAAGGDSRGRQSAAIYLASPGQGYGGFNDVLCDLRVDDHPQPIVELHRVYNLWRPNQLITEGYRLADQGKYAEAVARGEEAARLDPDSGQPFYHLACYHARSGDPEKAMHYLEWAVRLDAKLKKNAAQDPDLAPLRERADYRSLMEQ
jgi:uncharacterized Ntn-hydrolase superfamily protein